MGRKNSRITIYGPTTPIHRIAEIQQEQHPIASWENRPAALSATMRGRKLAMNTMLTQMIAGPIPICHKNGSLLEGIMNTKAPPIQRKMKNRLQRVIRTRRLVTTFLNGFVVIGDIL